MPANADQAEAWNEAQGRNWAANADALDRQIRPIGEAAMAAAGIKTGETILDVGCGCGQATLALAEIVGPNGRVSGLDISALLIGEAEKAAKSQGVGNVTFATGDAQTAGFEPEIYDLMFSRFGVMFFDDPTAAFTNLRRALKPQGRIAFCCWRELAQNVWMSLPITAAAALLPPEAAPPLPATAPGPFAFAGAERTASILRAAGFSDVKITPFDVLIGSGDLNTTLDLALSMGPLGARLRVLDATENFRSAVRSAVAEAMEPFKISSGEVLMPAAAWIVRAEN